MSVNNLILPFIEVPPTWTNLNVNSIKANNFIGSISDVKSGSEGPIIQDINPKTTSISFDTPFDIIPNISATLTDASITNKNSTVYISNKSTTGFDATVFIDNFSSHILETITSDCRQYLSIDIVNGHPAVSFNNFDDLFYMRSSDVNGITWGSKITASSVDNVGDYNTLKVVNGHPAIAYRNETDADVEYVRASDVNGDIWAPSQKILTAGIVGFNTTMEIVNNHPAIASFDSSASAIKYIRASDVNGNVWATPVNAISGIVNTIMNIVITDGYPAIAFSDFNNSSLAFMKASDVNGNNWANPVLLGINGFYRDAVMVNNHPAILYVASDNLYYVRASDVNGDTWANPVELASNTIITTATLNIINGKPAAAYHDNDTKDLNYLEALDSNGEIWTSEVALDNVDNTDCGCELIEVQSQFAITYKKGTDTLKYTSGDGSEGQYNIDYIAQ